MSHYSKCGSWTQGKGWRRTIGKKVGIGGRLMPCRFWLGMDKPKAMATALQIESLWVGLDAPYWSKDAWTIAEAFRVGATAKNEPEHEPAAMPTLKIVLTVKGLIERYRQAKINDSSLSPPSKHSITCRTKSLERSPIANMPLETVGAEQLAALVSYWLDRPHTRKGAPISECSARLIVKTARSVFDWADAVGLWLAPRRFDRLFRLPRSTNAPIVKTYSLGELTSLYQNANLQMKMFILLGLNCGFCSMEMATLKHSEIDLKAKIIQRKRQKNGNPMSWKLWTETATALARNTSESEGGLALTTTGGKPLVWYSENGHRVDVIPNRWERLLKQANENGEQPIIGSFKTLRKTGATMIRAIGGIEVSEMYLAHSEKTVAKYYSTPNHDHLATTLTAFRKQLAPMFKRTN